VEGHAFIMVNNQIHALFSMYLFISLLYMFRATQCSSSGEPNCINTSFGICHSHRLIIPDDVLIQLDSPDDEHLMLEIGREGK